jgi:hypothetical protein
MKLRWWHNKKSNSYSVGFRYDLSSAGEQCVSPIISRAGLRKRMGAVKTERHGMSRTIRAHTKLCTRSWMGFLSLYTIQ